MHFHPCFVDGKTRPEPVTGVPQGCTAGAKAPRDPDSCSLQRIPAPAPLLVRLARQASAQSQRAGAPGAAAHRLSHQLVPISEMLCMRSTPQKYDINVGLAPRAYSVTTNPRRAPELVLCPQEPEGLVSGAKPVSIGTRALQEPRAQV